MLFGGKDTKNLATHKRKISKEIYNKSFFPVYFEKRLKKERN